MTVAIEVYKEEMHIKMDHDVNLQYLKQLTFRANCSKVCIGHLLTPGNRVYFTQMFNLRRFTFVLSLQEINFGLAFRKRVETFNFYNIRI